MGCVTNGAYIAAANMQAGAIAAIAAIDITVQKHMAKRQREANAAITGMQEEIADRQMKLAEMIQTHAELFWTKEQQLLTDAFNNAEVQPDYINLRGQSHFDMFNATVAADVAQFYDRDFVAKLSTNEQNALSARFSRFQEMALADASSHGLRTAEARAMELNDRRYERQYKTVGVGRGMLAEVYGFQRSALIAGNAAGALKGAAINAALDVLGFGYQKLTAKMWGYGSAIRSNWESRVPAPEGVV